MRISVLFCIISILLCSCKAPQSSKSTEIVAVFDVKTPEPLPLHFRRSNDSIYFRSQVGLAQLHMSGSGQFSAFNLPNMLAKIPLRNVAIVDLREESHGYINGIPVSWKSQRDNLANVGKSVEQITNDEAQYLQEALKSGSIIVYNKQTPVTLKVLSAFTEESLAKKHGLGYIRIPVSDEHKPEPAVVDRFIDFVKQLPENTWLHFHCKMGQGRTTTFMTLYDIIRNGDRLKLKEIINRQYDLGGSDLLKTNSSDPEKQRWEIDRLNFLKQFYRYRQENKDLSIPFSEWLSKSPQLVVREVVAKVRF